MELAGSRGQLCDAREFVRGLQAGILELAQKMDEVAEGLQYYGGFAKCAVTHAAELRGAAVVARNWVKEISLEFEGTMVHGKDAPAPPQTPPKEAGEIA